jgi:hypothetical protein
MKPWEEQLNSFREGGVPEDVIAAEQDRLTTQMRDGGVPDEEIHGYFGTKPFDPTPVKETFGPYFSPSAAAPVDGAAPSAEPKSFLDAIEEVFNKTEQGYTAGWQGSVSGLLKNQKPPEVVLQENPEMYVSIANSVGSLVGDFPAMVGGYMAGGWAAGAAAGATTANPVAVAGASMVGAGAMSNAAPIFLRKALMDAYKDGGVKDWRDFWSKFAGTLVDRETWTETGKAALIGGASMGAGGIVNNVLGKVAAPAITKAAAAFADVGTMVTLGSAFEGQMPSLRNFTEASILILGIAGAGKVSGLAVKKVPAVSQKLRTMFAKTGMRPEELAVKAKENPLILQEILADNTDGAKLASYATDLPVESFVEAAAPEPGLWYHGTRADIKEFDPKTKGVNTGARSAKEGFFFVNDSGVAESYAITAPERAVFTAEKAFKDLKKFEQQNSIKRKADGSLYLDPIDGFGLRNPTLEKGTPEYYDKMGELKPLTAESWAEHLPGSKRTVEQGRKVIEKLRELEKQNEKANGEISDNPLQDAAIYPANLDMKNPLVVDHQGVRMEGAENSFTEIIKRAKEAGHDGVVIKNTFDDPTLLAGKEPNKKPHDVAVVFKPEQVKFKYSKDPIAEMVTKPIEEVLSRLDDERGSIQIADPPKAPPVRSQAELNIAAKFGVETEVKDPWTIKAIRSELRTDLLDHVNPWADMMRDAGKHPNKTAYQDNAYKMARSIHGATSKAMAMIKYNTFDKDLQITGEGFLPILDRTPDQGKLGIVMASLRAIELEKTDLASIEAGKGGRLDKNKAVKGPDGKKLKDAEGKVIREDKGTGFDYESAKTVVKEAPKEYLQLAKDVTEYRNRVTEGTLVESGILSKETFRVFKILNKNYVDFKRLHETEEGGLATKSKRAGSTKKLRGVGKNTKTVDPLLSAMRSTVDSVKRAEINKANQAAIKQLQELGPEYIQEVPLQTTVTKVTSDRLKEYLKKEYQIDLGEQELKSLDVYTQQARMALTKDQMGAWYDGKYKVFKVDEAIAKVSQSLDGSPAATNIFWKAVQGVSTAKKLLISTHPQFIAANGWRDQIMSAVNAKQWKVPFADVVQCMGDILGEKEAYQRFMMGGGGSSSFYDINRIIESDIMKLHKETNFLDAVQNSKWSPIRWLNFSGALVEQATRLSEFKRVSKGSADGGKIHEGVWASAENTLDFNKHGAKLQAWNSITAFLQVGLNGLDRTMQAFREDPKSVTTKGFAYITAPSLLLWAANHDEDWYKGIPRWEKDVYWHFNVDGKVRRLMKPMEMGIIFGSLPERLAEAMFVENPRAMKNFVATIWGSLLPNVTPDLLDPVWSQMDNTNKLSGGPLIPQHLEKYAPADQATEFTSETAKQLSKIIGRFPGIRDIGPSKRTIESPMVIDNYMQSLGGTWGRYLVKKFDEGLYAAGVAKDNRPAATSKETFFLGAFESRYPSAGDQRIKDFKDEFDKSVQFFNSKKLKIKDPVELKAFEQRYGKYMPNLNTFNEGINNLGDMIKSTADDPRKTKDDKRQLINQLYFRQIEGAKRGLEHVDKFNKMLQGK